MSNNIKGFRFNGNTYKYDYNSLENIPNLQTDKTLTVTDRPADAKAVGDEIESVRSAVGSPLVAATASAMTDRNKVYVYTGSESGYTNGNWYYHNGSTWTSGGVYNSSAVNTDTTLSVSGRAADAKKTGDEITDLKGALNDILDYATVVPYIANISGTRTVSVDVNIEAGTYIFSADIVSADTDSTTCLVQFLDGSTAVTSKQMMRGSGYSVEITLDDAINKITYFASNSWGNSANDDFSFSNVVIAKKSELKDDLEEALRGLKATNTITQSNYSTVLSNVNNADANSCYTFWMDKGTTSLPSNLPISKWSVDYSGGALLTFFNENANPAYALQIFIGGSGIFARVCANWSNKTWLDWGNIDSFSALSTYKTVKDNTISTVLSDANNAKDNSTYVLWLTKGGSVPSNFPFSAWNGDSSAGLLITMYTSGVSSYGYQLLIAKGEMWGRLKSGASSFLAWERLSQQNSVVHVAHNLTVTNLVEAVAIYGENTTFILAAEDYDIEAMYKAYYGNDYFINYDYSSGYTHKYDMGLYLKPGCKLIGQSGTRLVFDYDGTNSKVNQYFSIVETSMNNEIDNIELVGANDHFRYHIHDDDAGSVKGKNEFKNIIFTGTPNQTGCIGGGMGNGCTYLVENCLFKSGNVNSMYYHSPSGGNLKNKITVRGCYCVTSAPISFWWYGTGTYVTDCYAYDNRGNVECKAHTATPHDNVNMQLYAWNNVSVE